MGTQTMRNRFPIKTAKNFTPRLSVALVCTSIDALFYLFHTVLMLLLCLICLPSSLLHRIYRPLHAPTRSLSLYLCTCSIHPMCITNGPCFLHHISLFHQFHMPTSVRRPSGRRKLLSWPSYQKLHCYHQCKGGDNAHSHALRPKCRGGLYPSVLANCGYLTHWSWYLLYPMVW